MNIVFMGTPDFSVPCLKALGEAGHNIVGVFTQPDKPKNRGHKMQMPPVKEFALGMGYDVYQPLSLRRGDDAATYFDTLKKLNPDCIVVVAYGQILPRTILDLPKYGCINVHASLLPRYRGAAPIQWCVINGEKKTGVTTMYMADGIDTGDMIERAETEIPFDMTASELHDKLSAMGAELIASTLKKLENGTASRTAQDDLQSNYAKMLTKELCFIDFSRPAEEVYNLIRGLSSSPCAYTLLDGKRLKVYFAEIADGKAGEKAGTVIDGETLTVACEDGTAIRLTDVQPEGGKRMKAADFLRGNHIEDGIVLGI